MAQRDYIFLRKIINEPAGESEIAKFEPDGSIDCWGRARFNFGMYTIPTLTFFPKDDISKNQLFKLVTANSIANSESWDTSKVHFNLLLAVNKPHADFNINVNNDKTIKSSVSLILQELIVSADYCYVGMQEEAEGQVAFRFAETNAYQLLREHALFAYTRSDLNDDNNHGFFGLDDIFHSMTDGRLFSYMYMLGLGGSGQPELDTDHRNLDIEGIPYKHSTNLTGYYKPVGLSKFMAIMLEARRYGYAVSYQPEYGFYILRDIIVSYSFDALDYFITNELLEYGTVESISEAISAFNVSQGIYNNVDSANSVHSSILNKNGSSKNKKGSGANVPQYNAGLLKQTKSDYEVNDNEFVSRYSHMPGMRYDVNEYSPQHNSVDAPRSATERRLLSDIQMLHMQRNVRVAKIVINGEENVSKCMSNGIISRLIAFVGHETMCMTRGLNKSYEPSYAAERDRLENEKAIKAQKPANENMKKSNTGMQNARRILSRSGAFAYSTPKKLYENPDPAKFVIDSNKFKSFYSGLYETKLKMAPDVLANVSVDVIDRQQIIIELTFAEKIMTKYNAGLL